MPPYASQQDSSSVVSTSNNDNVFSDFGIVDAYTQKDAVAPGISPSLSQDTQDSGESSLSRFDKLLDFNPCTISAKDSAVSTPATLPSGRKLFPSTIYKRRKCVECEKNCSKFHGRYKVDTTQKVYYHKKCAQIKQYQNQHNKGFTIVLKELMDRSRAIELEAQRKRIEAQQKRMEVIRLEEQRNEHFQLEEDGKAVSSEKKKSRKKFMTHVKNTFLSCKGGNKTTDAVILANMKWAAIESGTSGNGYQEYLDIKTDRMYYTNGVYTTWNKPESYRPYQP